MSDYVTSALLTSVLPSIESAFIEKVDQINIAERIGSKRAFKEVLEIQAALEIYDYFAEKYIPEGTLVATLGSAYVFIDMSPYSGWAATANNVIINATSTLGGVVTTLFSGTYNIQGLTLNQFIDLVVAQINTNTGSTGFEATAIYPFIKIVDVDARAALVNGSVIDIKINPFFGIIIDEDYVSGAQLSYSITINEPGSTLDGYTISLDVTTGTLFLFYNGSQQESYTNSILQGVAMGQPVYNPTNDCIYIINANLRILIIERTAPNTFNISFTSPQVIDYNSNSYGRYNRINNAVYFTNNATSKLIRVDSDSITSPTITVVASANQLNKIEINNYTGQVISYFTQGVSIFDSSTNVRTYVASFSNANRISFIDNGSNATSYWMVSLPGGNIQIYDTNFTSLIYIVTIPTDLGSPRTSFYSNLFNKVFVTHGTNSNIIGIYDLNLEIAVPDLTLISAVANSGTCINQRLEDNPRIEVVTSDNKAGGISNTDVVIYIGYAFESQVNFDGVVQRGGSDILWVGTQNCLPDSQAQELLEILMNYLGVIECTGNASTSYSNNPSLSGNYTYLTTVTGIYITANSNFITV